jgi:hypothetical protein
VKPIILRPAKPMHMALIRQFHQEQNERDGTTYPLPRFFDKNGLLTDRVPVALVGVEDGSEDPVQAVWVERRAELMFAGCDPKATAFARRDIEGLAAVLTWLGYSGIHCDVPRGTFLDSVRKPLEAAGFSQNDERLAHFFRDLREKTL